MKKALSLLLVLVLCFSFSACGNNDVPVESEHETEKEIVNEEATVIRIASLKGPTSMGLVNLYDKADKQQLNYDLEYTISGAADEITPLLVNGEIDAAANPANLASVLYNKTEGKLVVAAVNTLGVLYVVDPGDDIQSIEDLRGKTIYTTGKGTTPEYALDYVLEKNGLDPDTDVKIEFSSEATEVTSLLTSDISGNAVAVLPQPYVTAALAQNETLRIALSLAEEWDKVADDSKLVTGVLVFNKEFASSNPKLVQSFMDDYSASISMTADDVDTTAALIEQYGIVAKAPIAKKALPFCNITFITGSDMKTVLSGYLQTLYDKNPAAVGGNLPADEFYFGA